MKLFGSKHGKYEAKHISPRRKESRSTKFLLPLCLILILGVCLTIGGTLAFMQEKTVTVTNTFKSGNITYTLNLEANAENVEMPSELTAQSSTSLSVTFEPNKAPTKIGYTFGGWYYNDACTDANLHTAAPGMSIAVQYGDTHDSNTDANKVGITLYAKWTPYTYTVKYENNVNPDDTSVTQPTGATADSTHTYDVAKNLTANGFTRTGYTFIGWNTQPDGKGTSYGNGESVINLTSVQNGTVTLYAQWGVKSYVLRYHANGGEGTMADQTIEWDKLTKISENKFVNNTGDYKFAGWSTTPTGEVEYLENQQVVNLQETGVLDLYAVWLLNSYTVTFDYNIGYGTPPTKEVLYGEEYGVLPPYLTTETENLFKGWYTAKEGGERVYPDTIVNRKDDHTLWAHWDPSPANDIIKDLVVHSSADDNNDGVADELHLEFVCSSSFEKFNIPLHNLVPGQTYALTYTTSNNASFGDYINGYKNARYGSYILPTATEDAGNINTAVAQDIIATWNNRIEPDGNNDGSQKATNDAWLNGPWENRTITFTATASTMYWAWEFGLIEDGIRYDYNIYDISLEPVEPNIEFGNKTLVIHSTSKAQVLNDSYSAYANNFVFDGDGYAETMYFPITGLTAGSTYTITFDHKITGGLINSSSYNYGCGISSTIPTTYGSYMENMGATWISTRPVFTKLNTTESVTLTFKATGSTAYWVWNMANCSDGTNCTIDIAVTKFSAKHSAGGSITYYDATSKATLEWMPEVFEPHSIEFVWDGIDDTNMDIWYPVDEQYPVAGDSYELAFEPLEGYTMAEIITVMIDDVAYEVYTNGQIADGMIAPVYDPENNILTIPAELLTAETRMVAVTASAVPVEISITTEPEETTELTETDTETETAAEEDVEITVALNLTNMTAQGDTTLQAGQDYSLVLVPDEGYELPEIIRVDVDGTLYEVYTDGMEHRTIAPSATELLPMPTFDPATGALTIPAVLLGESVEKVNITISAVEVVNVPTETASSENETQENVEENSEPTTVSSGDADVLPPDNKKEDSGDDTDDADEATTDPSKEVAEQ